MILRGKHTAQPENQATGKWKNGKESIREKTKFEKNMKKI